MGIQNRNLVLKVLMQPSLIRSMDATEWDLLIRQGRASGLSAKLYIRLEEQSLLSEIPSAPANHLLADRKIALRHQEVTRWEIQQIRETIEPMCIPLVLLKGGAYLQAGMAVADGRLFGDIDILVPRSRLDEAEARLGSKGWQSTHLDEYDQRYYRKWMHEIPPIMHTKRGSVIDLHHNILPLTDRLHPNPQLLLDAAIQLDDRGDVFRLCDTDLVLHSACHLFHDGDLEHGLRDLVDLDGLLREFGQDEGFWGSLTIRADEIGLQRPLYYALRYASQMLSTPVPGDVLEHMNQHAPVSPFSSMMDLFFGRALAPDHASCSDTLTGISRFVLYIRAHYLRMPLYLLIPHLLRKMFISPKGSD